MRGLAAALVLALAVPTLAQDGLQTLRRAEMQARDLAAARCYEEGRALLDDGAPRAALRAALAADELAPRDIAYESLVRRAQAAATRLLDRVPTTARLTALRAACVPLLSTPARAYERADRLEESDRLLALTVRHFPGAATYRAFGRAFDARYLAWLRPADVRRLDDGWEYVAGEWKDPETVASENTVHASWSNPWQVGDGVHVVHTTLPLDTALAVLAQVRAFRAFVLETFDADWPFTPPGRPLPVVLTATQAGLVEQVARFTGGAKKAPAAAAFYLDGPAPGSPCFLTLEPVDASGATVSIDLPGLLVPLRHEIAHQVLFEFLRGAGGGPHRPLEHETWAVEGIATFLSYHEPDGEGGWRLSRPAAVPFGAGREVRTMFGWAREHAAEPPPLAETLALSRTAFARAESFHRAAMAAAFFLTGDDTRQRSRFLDYVRASHVHEPGLPRFAIETADRAPLESAYRRFVRQQAEKTR